MTDNPKHKKQYGTWNSQIAAEHVAGKTMRFGATSSENDKIYWTECRPNEAGRCVIMSCKPGEEGKELLPAPFSARSQVHEYGGAEFLVRNQNIFFVNAKDQDIYHQKPGQPPNRITSQADTRFSDITTDGAEFLFSVAEYHNPKIFISSSRKLPSKHLSK